MAETNISVACIGLGRMGAGIAHNVQRAGFRLIVYNRTQEKAEPLITSGAALARTPTEAAQAADVVVTSLMDDASVLDVVNGTDGVLSGMRPGGSRWHDHHCANSQHPANLTDLHSSHGSEYVAAHALGRPDAAAAGLGVRLAEDLVPKRLSSLRTKALLLIYTLKTTTSFTAAMRYKPKFRKSESPRFTSPSEVEHSAWTH